MNRVEIPVSFDELEDLKEGRTFEWEFIDSNGEKLRVYIYLEK